MDIQGILITNYNHQYGLANDLLGVYCITSWDRNCGCAPDAVYTQEYDTLW